MPTYRTLISAEELAANIDQCIVVDSRHDIFDPEASLACYIEGHIPSASFVHLDHQLAAPRTGTNGRHPWPGREAVFDLLESLGLTDERQLVVYDTQGNQMAVRLWALARWVGHDAVAVLDGDMRAWRAAGYPLSQDPSPVRPRGSLSRNRPSLLGMVDADALMRNLQGGEEVVVDARAPDRYSGAIEQIDKVAGHIPGAIDRFYGRNLRPDGRFKPAEVLHEEFIGLLGQTPPEHVIHQCGSGVTACHNILAMEHAGLHGSRLYPGSWSEWIADPSRPVATGDQPQGSAAA